MKPDGLWEVEWNFDDVPDDELAACCLWEYARECSSFATTSARHAEAMAAIRARTHPAPCDLPEYEALLEAYWGTDEGYMQYYETIRTCGGPAALPWQLIRAEVRVSLSKQVGVHEVSQPLAPAMRRQLEALWKANLVEWEPVRNEPGYDPEEDGMAYEESLPHVDEPGHKGEPYGETVIAFAVDFRKFSDKEIAGVFAAWLKANRPEDAPEPTGRGHKPGDWRANLTRLAVMRLLGRYTPGEILGTTKTPALKQCEAIRETRQFAAAKWSDATKWHDARREAGRLFRQLFPFLPPDEKPLSWERPAPGP